MRDFLTWLLRLAREQRGAIGDDPPDDTPDETKEDQTADDDDYKDEDFDEELLIDLNEKEDEEDKDKDKDKTKDSEEVEKLRSELDTLKEKEKEWKRDMYQARKDRERTKVDTDKEKPLSDAHLTKLLEDADTEGDTQVKLNVLKYLAQRISKGEVKEAVTAAEMSRKAEGFNKQLEDKFPDVANPTSDIRADLDQVKAELHIADHPFADMFAVGFKLFQDMDGLIEAAFEGGKEEALKGTADEKRKKEIKDNSLPSSKRTPYTKTYGMSKSALETAVQMNLTQDQLPAYVKLLGKKARTVSVEE